ncbi:hypothetical protein H5410_044735 [Solanum commersonii]|uniref:Replication factor A C-terminal domain-containing protein n=1 Tax=Solanum commersonii TaxID=4109 RepID=A0A9J5X9T9_SOLCO|nr:hypothetical protein H5410_044735 [Solanum commersonii]
MEHVKMVQKPFQSNLSVFVELATQDWICKVQIVEIGRPRESPDKKCRFQNLILEDEEECQIKAVMYADEIDQYAEKIKLINTYLISTTRVKISPTAYGKPIHKLYWILDKETVIEHIKSSNELEKPLPPPTKLNITTFDRIPHMMVDSTAEIGISILIVIIRLKYTCLLIHTITTFHYVLYKQIYWQSFFVVVLKNTQVAVIISVGKLVLFLLTLWEDLGEIEGNEIAAKMATEADLIVILERSIRISTYQDNNKTLYKLCVIQGCHCRLGSIPQAKENKTMLLSGASEKTSTRSSAAPMIVTHAGQQVISIAQMSSAASMGLFYVEAEMAISDEFQEFCVLVCSRCKQKKRTKDRKDFECPKCNRKTTLMPRCIFQIDLTDGTATTTTSISGELGEKLLSMTAEDIFDITCAKLRKSSWGNSNNTHATLSILSYMEKEHTPQSTTDRNSKKIRPLEISEVEVMATTTTVGSSNATPKFESPNQPKRCKRSFKSASY